MPRHQFTPAASDAPPYTPRTLNAVLRRDFASFIQKCFHTVSPGRPFRHNWHIEAIAWHLQQCSQGRIKRLLITLPPRSLKSICASVAFPAWMLGHDPTRRIICVSYAIELSTKHARDFRSVIDADWYRAIFPRTGAHKDTELEYVTTRKGFRFSTSIGGTLTGRGGSLIIIDDPLRPEEGMSKAARQRVKQWYDGTLYSRLDSKTEDVIILIMQRLHLDDLAGHVLQQEEWTHLNLPAVATTDQRIAIGADLVHKRTQGDVLHPEREPLSALDQAKAILGSFFFEAQYQQSPVPEGGNLIKWGWFRTYGELPDRQPEDRIVQSWDTASKAEELNDYSVCTTWLKKKNDAYLIEVTCRRLDYPSLKRCVVDLQRRHQANVVLIEDKGSGTPLIQELRRDSSLRPIAIKPVADKITRMSTQSAKIEAGQVHLPERASWLADFQTEILAFPMGRHDDQVDSLSQFLNWAYPERRPLSGTYKLGGMH